MRAHGTRARYVFGAGPGPTEPCRCVDCSIAAGDYEKERQRLRAAGIEAYIDATEAREHLRFLRERNVGRRTVAAQTGLGQSTIAKIASGQRTRIRPETADKILAVGLHRGSSKTWVDASATWRLIDDMVAHGITKRAIGRAIGQGGHSLQLERTRIEKRNAEAVRAFYDEVMADVVARREYQAAERARYRRVEAAS